MRGSQKTCLYPHGCTSVPFCGIITLVADSNDELVQRFGHVVKARREELGMSQADLAAALGRPVGTLSAIEQGRRKTGVSGRTQVALDRALQWQSGSSRDVLAGGDAAPLRVPHSGVTLNMDEDPNVRILLDEVSLAAPGDRDRLVRMLVGAVRAWRDDQSS